MLLSQAQQSRVILSFLKRYDRGGSLSSNGAEVAVTCPFHKAEGSSASRKMYVNPIKGLYICFKCDARGNVGGLLRRLRRKYPGKYDDIDFDSLPATTWVPEPISTPSPAHLPPGWQPLFPESGIETAIGWKALRYLRKRGIDGDLTELYRLGYCMTGPMAYRIIVPTYQNEKLVYWLGRDFTNTQARKVKNPSSAEVGSGSKDWVFGLNLAGIFDSAVLTEGVFDAMSVRPPAGHVGSGLALFGKSMSDRQFSKIMAAKFKRLTILLDADAEPEIMRIASRFRQTTDHRAPDVYMGLLSEGDPNSSRDHLESLLRVVPAPATRSLNGGRSSVNKGL